jgi:16S rRNA A1518/A1519 N6-dimethyltransferase RsmA/KsgA/DIM1 with predicted DNA glycosylase/AP lyase activity
MTDYHVTDEELLALARPDVDQFFLTAPDVLDSLVSAAGIRPTDHVLELGAGVGTVARHLPPSATLALVEIDDRLVPALKRNMPRAVVINYDGVLLLREQALTCDVLLCNLPHAVTDQLVPALPDIDFRTAVIAAGSLAAFEAVAGRLSYEVVTVAGGDDFTPAQPVTSLFVRVERTDYVAGLSTE